MNTAIQVALLLFNGLFHLSKTISIVKEIEYEKFLRIKLKILVIQLNLG